MKKLSLVIAVAAALPVLAHADVTISGNLAVGIGSTKTTEKGVRQTGVDDYGSKIRFTGEEDLGNGLKALFKVENGFNTDGVPTGGSGSGLWANRQTYIGLSHDSFGVLRIGYVNDILGDNEAADNLGGARGDRGYATVPTYDNGLLPAPFYGASPDGGTKFFAGDGRAKNTIRWDSPTWAGISASVQYAAGENATANTKAQDYWGYRIGYTTPDNKWFVNGLQWIMTSPKSAISNSSTSRLEAGFNGDALSFAVSYSLDSMYGDTTAASGAWVDSGTSKNYNTFFTNHGISNVNSHLTARHLAVYASYTVGAWKTQAVISQMKNWKVDGQELNTGVRQFGISEVYQASKRTSFELGYGLQNENAQYSEAMRAQAGDSTKFQTSSGSTVYLQVTHKF
ncbi:porin [Paludibacterium sp. B53371]|uniref:porin n=1 Tax=Paludibacterium sp. B53371 TaxID=2806263 RepID=UPI001C05ECC6|nr:porin [Paludibacterium sp. B53371]